MRLPTLAFTVFAALASSSSQAQVTSTHVFFPTITHGDIAGATAMIDGNIAVADWQQAQLKHKSFTPAEFFDRIKPCYFRIAFAKTEDPNVEAGLWMCSLTPTASNPNLSRVIMIQASYKGERVSLDSYNEQDSMNPAPAPGH